MYKPTASMATKNHRLNRVGDIRSRVRRPMCTPSSAGATAAAEATSAAGWTLPAVPMAMPRATVETVNDNPRACPCSTW